MIILNHIKPTMDTDDRISINESIYHKLMQLIPSFESQAGTRCKRTSHISHRRDLHYRYIEDAADGHYIALSHDYIDATNLDIVPDPEMLIRIVPEKQFAEAVSYQDQFAYNQVRQEHEGEPFIHYKLLGELNEHLNGWLSRLIVYGHSIDISAERGRSHEPRGRRAIAQGRDHSPETDVSR